MSAAVLVVVVLSALLAALLSARGFVQAPGGTRRSCRRMMLMPQGRRVRVRRRGNVVRARRATRRHGSGFPDGSGRRKGSPLPSGNPPTGIRRQRPSEVLRDVRRLEEDLHRREKD